MNSDPALGHIATEVLEHAKRLDQHHERISKLEEGHTAATAAAVAAAEAAARIEHNQEGFEESIHSALVAQRTQFANIATAELDAAFSRYQEKKAERIAEEREAAREAAKKQAAEDARADRRRKWILAIVVATLGVLSPALAAIANRISAPPPAQSAAPVPTLDVGELARKIDELEHQRHDERK